MVIGLLRAELHLPRAQSLKDKRSVLQSVKDQLRGRFNISVADVDSNETWQRASLGVAAAGAHQRVVEAILGDVAAWLRGCGLIAVIRLDADYLSGDLDA